MTSLQTHYFVRSHSNQGLTNQLETNLYGLSSCAILSGSCEIVREMILNQVATSLIEKNIPFESIHSIHEPSSLEGIIIRKNGTGIVSSELCEEQNSELLNNAQVFKIGENIPRSQRQEAYIQEAYQSFSLAKDIHDEWEAVYIKHMDFAKADNFCEEFIASLFEDVPSGKNAIVRHRFFGGATYKGSVDYVSDIINRYTKKHYIKGRPGSGKSTFLKKIMNQAKEKGIDVNVYHCGFDPRSLDMIEIPSMDFVIFDSTAPHEYEPSSDDIVIDMYEQFIEAGTDERNKATLTDINKRYQTYVSAGTRQLMNAHNLQLSSFGVTIPLPNERKIADISETILAYLIS